MSKCFSITESRNWCLRSTFSKSGLRSTVTDLQDGTIMHCWVPKTRKESKPDLLLIHGFGTNAMWQWSELIPHVAPHFNIYLPDLVFFGNSYTTRPERTESFQAQCVFCSLWCYTLDSRGKREKAAMGWFPCSGESNKKAKKKQQSKKPDDQIPSTSEKLKVNSSMDVKKEASKDGRSDPIAAYTYTFTFNELAAATKNFRPDCLLGEGGFGRVYKGRLESTNQIVAIKQLDRNGLQGNREFLVEVLMLSLLHHPNLVNLIGYCADGDQRLLVYEYMPLGSLEDHLHDLPPDKKRLDWNTRMKIAAGAARGLEFLHDKASPPVIYRDLKCSNILLGEGYHPKLSDFGLAKLGPVGDNTHVSTRVMGTYGYCAPEYAMTGQLTLKSDVYSFGVVLLEIITGRKAIDNSKAAGEHNLVAWARPLFKDRRKFSQMADPMLQGQYPDRGLYQALAVAAMCVQEQSTMRPLIADVVTALSYLASQNYDPETQPVQSSRSGPSTPRFRREQ